MKRQTLFHYLPYVLAFILLKPIISSYDGNTSLSYNMRLYKYFDYKEENFVYALIIVAIAYLIINYKRLTKK
tara:strand:+ start:139 stop:354 length:216 start_codon:yes stop_codon:yes gene_type:complete